MAVVFHEIPQEIGDFALLLFSGFTRWRALSLNFLSACVSFVGALAVVFLSTSVLPILSAYLLPLAAGNFLYIAGSDLIPELHRETRFRSTIAQLFCILLGISVMFALTLFE
jgi:zinc and cadmium transporter